MFKHHKQPRQDSCCVSHQPGGSGHGHVIPLSPIQNTHPHQSGGLGLIGRQVPPTEKSFHEPVDGQGVVEKVVLLT